MKHKLVAVVGNTPQVMTETFWALRIQRHVPIEEVYVITTTVGKEICQKRLLDEGRFEEMLVDYNIDPNYCRVRTPSISTYLKTPRAIC